MQKVGDVCENCRPRWEKQEKEPRVLQRLGKTQGGHIVPACPFCDGEPIIEIAQRNMGANGTSN